MMKLFAFIGSLTMADQDLCHGYTQNLPITIAPQKYPENTVNTICFKSHGFDEDAVFWLLAHHMYMDPEYAEGILIDKVGIKLNHAFEPQEQFSMGKPMRKEYGNLGFFWTHNMECALDLEDHHNSFAVFDAQDFQVTFSQVQGIQNIEQTSYALTNVILNGEEYFSTSDLTVSGVYKEDTFYISLTLLKASPGVGLGVNFTPALLAWNNDGTVKHFISFGRKDGLYDVANDMILNEAGDNLYVATTYQRDYSNDNGSGIGLYPVLSRYNINTGEQKYQYEENFDAQQEYMMMALSDNGGKVVICTEVSRGYEIEIIYASMSIFNDYIPEYQYYDFYESVPQSRRLREDTEIFDSVQDNTDNALSKQENARPLQCTGVFISGNGQKGGMFYVKNDRAAGTVQHKIIFSVDLTSNTMYEQIIEYKNHDNLYFVVPKSGVYNVRKNYFTFVISQQYTNLNFGDKYYSSVIMNSKLTDQDECDTLNDQLEFTEEREFENTGWTRAEIYVTSTLEPSTDVQYDVVTNIFSGEFDETELPFNDLSYDTSQKYLLEFYSMCYEGDIPTPDSTTDTEQKLLLGGDYSNESIYSNESRTYSHIPLQGECGTPIEGVTYVAIFAPENDCAVYDPLTYRATFTNCPPEDYALTFQALFEDGRDPINSEFFIVKVSLWVENFAPAFDEDVANSVLCLWKEDFEDCNLEVKVSDPNEDTGDTLILEYDVMSLNTGYMTVVDLEKPEEWFDKGTEELQEVAIEENTLNQFQLDFKFTYDNGYNHETGEYYVIRIRYRDTMRDTDVKRTEYQYFFLINIPNNWITGGFWSTDLSFYHAQSEVVENAIDQALGLEFIFTAPQFKMEDSQGFIINFKLEAFYGEGMPLAGQPFSEFSSTENLIPSQAYIDSLPRIYFEPFTFDSVSIKVPATTPKGSYLFRLTATNGANRFFPAEFDEQTFIEKIVEFKINLIVKNLPSFFTSDVQPLYCRWEENYECKTTVEVDDPNFVDGDTIILEYDIRELTSDSILVSDLTNNAIAMDHFDNYSMETTEVMLEQEVGDMFSIKATFTYDDLYDHETGEYYVARIRFRDTFREDDVQRSEYQYFFVFNIAVNSIRAGYVKNENEYHGHYEIIENVESWPVGEEYMFDVPDFKTEDYSAFTYKMSVWPSSYGGMTADQMNNLFDDDRDIFFKDGFDINQERLFLKPYQFETMKFRANNKFPKGKYRFIVNCFEEDNVLFPGHFEGASLVYHQIEFHITFTVDNLPPVFDSKFRDKTYDLLESYEWKYILPSVSDPNEGDVVSIKFEGLPAGASLYQVDGYNLNLEEVTNLLELKGWVTYNEMIDIRLAVIMELTDGGFGEQVDEDYVYTDENFSIDVTEVDLVNMLDDLGISIEQSSKDKELDHTQFQVYGQNEQFYFMFMANEFTQLITYNVTATIQDSDSIGEGVIETASQDFKITFVKNYPPEVVISRKIYEECEKGEFESYKTLKYDQIVEIKALIYKEHFMKWECSTYFFQYLIIEKPKTAKDYRISENFRSIIFDPMGYKENIGVYKIQAYVYSENDSEKELTLFSEFTIEVTQYDIDAPNLEGIELPKGEDFKGLVEIGEVNKGLEFQLDFQLPVTFIRKDGEEDEEEEVINQRRNLKLGKEEEEGEEQFNVTIDVWLENGSVQAQRSSKTFSGYRVVQKGPRTLSIELFSEALLQLSQALNLDMVIVEIQNNEFDPQTNLNTFKTLILKSQIPRVTEEGDQGALVAFGAILVTIMVITFVVTFAFNIFISKDNNIYLQLYFFLALQYICSFQDLQVVLPKNLKLIMKDITNLTYFRPFAFSLGAFESDSTSVSETGTGVNLLQNNGVLILLIIFVLMSATFPLVTKKVKSGKIQQIQGAFFILAYLVLTTSSLRNFFYFGTSDGSQAFSAILAMFITVFLVSFPFLMFLIDANDIYGFEIKWIKKIRQLNTNLVNTNFLRKEELDVQKMLFSVFLCHRIVYLTCREAFYTSPSLLLGISALNQTLFTARILRNHPFSQETIKKFSIIVSEFLIIFMLYFISSFSEGQPSQKIRYETAKAFIFILYLYMTIVVLSLLLDSVLKKKIEEKLKKLVIIQPQVLRDADYEVSNDLEMRKYNYKEDNISSKIEAQKQQQQIIIRQNQNSEDGDEQGEAEEEEEVFQADRLYTKRSQQQIPIQVESNQGKTLIYHQEYQKSGTDNLKLEASGVGKLFASNSLEEVNCKTKVKVSSVNTSDYPESYGGSYQNLQNQKKPSVVKEEDSSDEQERSENSESQENNSESEEESKTKNKSEESDDDSRQESKQSQAEQDQSIFNPTSDQESDSDKDSEEEEKSIQKIEETESQDSRMATSQQSEKQQQYTNSERESDASSSQEEGGSDRSVDSGTEQVENDSSGDGNDSDESGASGAS